LYFCHRAAPCNSQERRAMRVNYVLGVAGSTVFLTSMQTGSSKKMLHKNLSLKRMHFPAHTESRDIISLRTFSHEVSFLSYFDKN
jgi:hypothetical protein